MKSSVTSVVISFPLALFVHYMVFSNLKMSSTGHALVGMVIFFMMLGLSKILLDQKLLK